MTTSSWFRSLFVFFGTILNAEGLRVTRKFIEKEEACHNKFYLYALPEELDDEPESKSEQYLGKMDKRLGFDNFYPKEGISFPGTITHRISRSACATTEPEDADVFMIPLKTRKKTSTEWRRTCRHVNTQKLVDKLKHLNNETTHRHIIFHNHGNWNQGCSGWWQNPVPELKYISRFTVEDRRVTTIQATVPYNSEIHYTADASTPPWAQERERPYLASFVGSIRGFPHERVSKGHRKGVIASCNKHSDVCRLYSSGSAKRQFDTQTTFEIYSKSEFCMHPPGDSMLRKGIVDSLLLGCIPVVFEAAQVGAWPWHWGDFKNTSLIFVHPSSHDDPVAVLMKIPVETRKQMRASIAKHAHKMQYAKDEPPADKPDALNVIVDHVMKGETELHAVKAYEHVVRRFTKVLNMLHARTVDVHTDFTQELISDMPHIVGVKEENFLIR